MEKHEKTELTLHTVKTDVKRMVDEERFEYTGAFLLWLVAFLLLDVLLCAFAGYWVFLTLLAPVFFYARMCVKWHRVISDLNVGRIVLEMDKLAYRKTEHELNGFTFINRLPLGRTFSLKKLTTEKEYLHFESGKKAPCVHNGGVSDVSDVERIYYLVCVGGREQPFCAYNAQLFEPSKRDGDAVSIG